MEEEVGGTGRAIGLQRMRLRKVCTSGKRASLRPSVRLLSGHSRSGGVWAGDLSARKLGTSLWELQGIPSLAHMRQMALQRYKLEMMETGDQQDFPCLNSSIKASSSTCSNNSKGALQEPEYQHNTAAEQIKILNRIWSLEERYASSISLIKAVKVELNHALFRVQELLQMQKAGYHELVDLRSEVFENEISRMNKEEDMNVAALHSLNEDSANERKLRSRVDYFHHKVSMQLSEMKSAYSMAMEGWCDEDFVMAKLREVRLEGKNARWDAGSGI